MADYRVIAQRSSKRIRQRFWCIIVDARNGKTIWRTDTYRDKDHAVRTGQTWAGICDGTFIDAT